MAPDKLILHVSRYDTHRILYSDVLENAGYSVLTANSGHSAKTELERMSPGGVDLVIIGGRSRTPGIEELEKQILSMGDQAPPIIVHSGIQSVKLIRDGDPPIEKEKEDLYMNSLIKRYIKGYVLKESDSELLLKAVLAEIGNP